ncbi:tripeptidyl-peptidase I [Purpureocillium lavendulum]|uniref:Tripeptidyl-peptidase I n=1 Tax=Purpureocillium lavendulum TaxID=1247861 RepID=A0AB34G7P1_9HYPO|nr:tripeptidyl-peptidase I [Purpureocillium lavendulum]
MRMRALLLLTALVDGTRSVPTSTDGHILHEKRSDETHFHAWAKREPVDPSIKIPVRIALKQRNVHRGMDLVLEVSDPSHASGKYGQWYSREQVIDLFAPSDESVSKVQEWLILSGITKDSIIVPETKGWVHFESTVGQLQSLVKADYHLYDHILARDETHLGTDEYHLPEGIAAHVDFIVPGTAFMRVRGEANNDRRAHKRKTGGAGGSRKGRFLTPMQADIQSANPDCLRTMYNIPPGKTANPANRLGIFQGNQGSIVQYYIQSDMDMFVQKYAPWVPQNFTPAAAYGINNATTISTNPKLSGDECQLDFQMAVPLIYPQSTVLYTVDFSADRTYADTFNPFLDALDGSYCNRTAHGYTGDTPKFDDNPSPIHDCGTVAPTNVISFSYGMTEPYYTGRYLERQCEEWMKLALSGTTIVFASGDDGVASSGIECQGKNHDIFMPDAPSGCPYVTSVGGTVLEYHKRPGDKEIATNFFSSGGGFSNVYKTPSYQKAAVTNYLSQYPPSFPSFTTSRGQVPKTGGVYNRDGRGYPDLSAVAEKSAIVVGGDWWLSAGTSMSAPIVAAMFTLVNEERLAAGKTPIGFVNPVLYQNPGMFNDIVVGSQKLGGLKNDGCGSGGGFHCQPGWDPVTGMGTPNYKKMLKVFMDL